MDGELKKHQLNLKERDYKCFRYLCEELGVKNSERIRFLIKEDLKRHQEIILKAMDKQKEAIDKRSKNGH